MPPLAHAELVHCTNKHLFCTKEHLLADKNALVNEKETCSEKATSVIKDLGLRIIKELTFETLVTTT